MTTFILSGTRVNDADKPGAVLYDNTTGMALACPVFTDADEAQAFLDWLAPTDPREPTDLILRTLVIEFRCEQGLREAQC